MTIDTVLKLRNTSDNKFVDISSEQFRSYTFAESEVYIDKPQYLAVSAGGHRVLDAQGVSHYIPKGWIHLKWKAYGDKPHFVK
jgi:hypothetical protein